MRPPEKIYREPQKSFLIVMYPGWGKKPNTWALPYEFHNFIPPEDIIVDKSYIEGITKNLFMEFLNSAPEEFIEASGDCYLYAIEFPNEDEYADAQGILADTESDGESIEIARTDIETIYKYLLTYPQYEILIKPAKNGEEPEQTQAGEL